MDEDGNEVVLDERESDCLFLLTGGLEAATDFGVSRLSMSGARVGRARRPARRRAAAPVAAPSCIDLADEAPTLHLYVVDSASDCEHPHWRDPLFDEWLDAGVAPGPHVRR